MKRILSCLFLSVFPALVYAGGEDVNFYGKVGVDLTSRFESMQLTANNDGPKSIPVSSKKNTFSPSIFLEATYNVLPQTEVGLGIGYIKRKGFHHVASWGVHTDGVYTEGRSDNTAIETYKVNRYSSLPIYVVLKQNIALNQNSKLYFTAHLGYAINKIDNTHYKHYLDLAKEGDFKLNEGISQPRKLKVKNGLYLGLGVGVEYKSFLAEVGYYHTDSKVTRPNFVQGAGLVNQTTSYNNDAVRLSVGFRF